MQDEKFLVAFFTTVVILVVSVGLMISYHEVSKMKHQLMSECIQLHSPESCITKGE